MRWYGALLLVAYALFVFHQHYSAEKRAKKRWLVRYLAVYGVFCLFRLSSKANICKKLRKFVIGVTKNIDKTQVFYFLAPKNSKNLRFLPLNMKNRCCKTQKNTIQSLSHNNSINHPKTITVVVDCWFRPYTLNSMKRP